MPLHSAHEALLNASSVSAVHVWVENRWLFIETDTQAAGVPLSGDLMDEVHVAEIAQTLEAFGFVPRFARGWFSNEPRKPIGHLDITAIRDVVSKLRRAVGTKADNVVREYEFTPDSVLATNRYTLARRPVTTGVTQPFTLTIDAVDAIMSSQAERLVIRLGRRSVAYVLDGVARVEALPQRPMSLHGQVALIDEKCGEPHEIKRLEFGRMIKSIEPNREDRRMLPAPYMTDARQFGADRVSQAYGTLAGPTMTWSLTPNILVMADTLGTRAYVQGIRF